MRNKKVIMINALGLLCAGALPILAQDSPFARTVTAIDIDVAFWIRTLAGVVVAIMGVMLLMDRGGNVGGKIVAMIIGLAVAIGARGLVNWFSARVGG